jgi:hypothetical protein
MLITRANRGKPYAYRKVLKLGVDRLYYFTTPEAPKTGFYCFIDGTFIGYMTALKYSAIMVF